MGTTDPAALTSTGGSNLAIIIVVALLVAVLVAGIFAARRDADDQDRHKALLKEIHRQKDAE